MAVGFEDADVLLGLLLLAGGLGACEPGREGALASPAAVALRAAQGFAEGLVGAAPVGGVDTDAVVRASGIGAAAKPGTRQGADAGNFFGDGVVVLEREGFTARFADRPGALGFQFFQL